MARKKSKLTPLQAEYKKQQNRIKNFIRNAQKRGYTFPENIVPEMPKRVTKKSLEDIKWINPTYLYNRARHTSSFGTTESGREWRKIERKVSGRKGAETRAIRKIMDETEFTHSEAFNLYHSKDYNYKDKVDVELYKYKLQQSYQDEDYEEQYNNIYTSAEPKPYYVEQPEPISPYSTPEEQVEYYQKKLQEAIELRDQISGKPEQKDLVTEAEENNPFYKKLKEQIDRDGKEAHEAYKQRRKEYKNAREEVQKMEDGVLKYVEKMISEWEGVPGWTEYWEGVKRKDTNLLASMLNGAISSEGRTEVARRMQMNAERVIELASYICYGSGGKESSGRNDLNMAFAEFSSIIMGRPLTFEENVQMTEQAEEGIVTEDET